MNPALELAGIGHLVHDAGEMKPTLAALNHHFASGRLNVVGGPSGSGKTTLLSILSLTINAALGTLCYAGEKVSDLTPKDAGNWRRRNIGMVFQTSRLIKIMTVKEHIRLAAATRGKDEAVGVGLAFIDQLGLGDKLTARPDQLSGGEKQRVAIAQALCFNPPILLADEPTAALDQTNAMLVAKTLRNYARSAQAIVICVSHDRAVIDAADDLLMLEKP